MGKEERFSYPEKELAKILRLYEVHTTYGGVYELVEGMRRSDISAIGHDDYKLAVDTFAQKLLKLNEGRAPICSFNEALEIIDEAYRSPVPAICLDDVDKIFFVNALAEKLTRYGLRESKMSEPTIPKRGLRDLLMMYREEKRTEVTDIEEIVIPTRDQLKLHIRPYIKLIDGGAIVVIKKAFRINPATIINKLFGAFSKKDVYFEASRIIDHHSINGSELEKRLFTYEIKRIINRYLQKGREKFVIDLSCTEHIGKHSLNLFASWTKHDKNFFLYNPSDALYQKLMASGFPEANVRLEEEKKPADKAAEVLGEYNPGSVSG